MRLIIAAAVAASLMLSCSCDILRSGAEITLPVAQNILEPVDFGIDVHGAVEHRQDARAVAIRHATFARPHLAINGQEVWSADLVDGNIDAFYVLRTGVEADGDQWVQMTSVPCEEVAVFLRTMSPCPHRAPGVAYEPWPSSRRFIIPPPPPPPDLK